MAWTYACRFSDLREGEGKKLRLPNISEDPVAIFLHRGDVYALEDRCCHKQKSIHGGDLEDLGECVIGSSGELGVGGPCVQCPRHQRKFGGGLYFNLETGVACTPELTKAFRKLHSHRLKSYEAVVDSGKVFISVGYPQVLQAKRRKTQPSLYEQGMQPTVIDAEDSSPEISAEGEQVSLKAALHMHQCVLEKVERANHDTLLFCVHHPVQQVLPVAPESAIWHVSFHAIIDGKAIERDYTPISDWCEWRDQRRIRFIIKIYRDGAMTGYLAAKAIGSTIAISDPHATLLSPTLLPPGKSVVFDAPSHIVLFAAGTGITPMLQVIQDSLSNPGRVHSITLLYSNKSYLDLLCWDELCSLSVPPGGMSLRIWLAFTSPKPGHETEVPTCATLAGVRHQRIDATLVRDALAPLEACSNTEKVRALVSGPELQGFFDAMRNAFPVSSDTFVNLDE